MENMEYIDAYFKSLPGAAEQQHFTERVINDILFAEDVAFYMSANGIVKEQLQQEKKERFREIYQQRKVIPITKQPVKKVLRYMAAASVVAAIMIFTWFLSGRQTSPHQLAGQYIDQNFITLSTTMSIQQDSLQYGLSLLNDGKLTEALGRFESIQNNDPANTDAVKYAGIAALRLEEYNKALQYFTILENDTALYSNPGRFYHAITLLQRNSEGDKAAAKLLLQQVAINNLEGKTEAVKWLKKM